MGVAASGPDQERVATKIIFINVQGKYEIVSEWEKQFHGQPARVKALIKLWFLQVQFPVGSTSDELKELFFSASGLSSKYGRI